MNSACTILMYHVVGAPRGPHEGRTCCPSASFARQMQCLAEEGWNVIPLAALMQARRGEGHLPPRAVVITFDDGTACTHAQALPVLRKHGFPATVFVVAGLIGGRCDWADSGRDPGREMLSVPQLRELSASGVSIGSHAVQHRRLAGLPAADLLQEVAGSKALLEDALGAAVPHFAYPYGSHDRATVDAVQAAGYEAACSTLMGRNRSAASPFLLQRTEIKGGDALWQFRLKLHAGTHDMPPWSVLRSAARRTLRASLPNPAS